MARPQRSRLLPLFLAAALLCVAGTEPEVPHGGLSQFRVERPPVPQGSAQEPSAVVGAKAQPIVEAPVVAEAEVSRKDQKANERSSSEMLAALVAAGWPLRTTASDFKGQVAQLEKRLSGTFRALPGSDSGRISYEVVRYLASGYLRATHGWQSPDLDQARAFHEVRAIKDGAPALRDYLNASGFAQRGMSLREAATYIVALEELFTSEAVPVLAASLGFNNFSSTSRLRPSSFRKVIRSFAVLLWNAKIAVNFSDFTTMAQESKSMIWWKTLAESTADISDTFVAMEQHRANPFVSRPFSIEHLWKAARRVMRAFGGWQNGECAQMKLSLTRRGKNGRVRLPDFYQADKDSAVSCVESAAVLAETGALDTSSEEDEKVILSNYLQGNSNCLAHFEHFSMCCLDECVGLMAAVETGIQAPSATPAELLEVVSALRSATVSAPRRLSMALRLELHHIADLHGGRVPLHGRLFSQWLHYAYPNECPYPMEGKPMSFGPKSECLDNREYYYAQGDDIRLLVDREYRRDMRREYHEQVPLWTDYEVLPLQPDVKVPWNDYLLSCGAMYDDQGTWTRKLPRQRNESTKPRFNISFELLAFAVVCMLALGLAYTTLGTLPCGHRRKASQTAAVGVRLPGPPKSSAAVPEAVATRKAAVAPAHAAAKRQGSQQKRPPRKKTEAPSTNVVAVSAPPATKSEAAPKRIRDDADTSKDGSKTAPKNKGATPVPPLQHRNHHKTCADESSKAMPPDGVKPAKATEKPDADGERPIQTTEKPDAGGEKLVQTTEKPDADGERPIQTTEKLDAGGEKRVQATEKPDADGERPIQTTEKPDADGRKLVQTTEKPDAGGEKRVQATEKPDANGEKLLRTTEKPDAKEVSGKPKKKDATCDAQHRAFHSEAHASAFDKAPESWVHHARPVTEPPLEPKKRGAARGQQLLQAWEHKELPFAGTEQSRTNEKQAKYAPPASAPPPEPQKESATHGDVKAPERRVHHAPPVTEPPLEPKERGVARGRQHRQTSGANKLPVACRPPPPASAPPASAPPPEPQRESATHGGAKEWLERASGAAMLPQYAEKPSMENTHPPRSMERLRQRCGSPPAHSLPVPPPPPPRRNPSAAQQVVGYERELAKKEVTNHMVCAEELRNKASQEVKKSNKLAQLATARSLKAEKQRRLAETLDEAARLQEEIKALDCFLQLSAVALE